MKFTAFCLVTAVLTAGKLFAAASIPGVYLLNGDFEVLDPGEPLFEHWENNAGASLASTPISGNYSARLSQASGGHLMQELNDSWQLLSEFSIELDLALGNPGSNNRAFNLIINHSPSGQINLKIDGTTEGMGDIQVFDGSGWVTVLSDGVEFSESEAELTVNRMVIEGDYSGSTPFYRIHAGGETSDPVTAWQAGAPVAGSQIWRLNFQTPLVHESAWAVVDNIVVDGPGLVAHPEEGDVDYAFGTMFFAEPDTDTEARTVQFINVRDEELTIQEISILDDAEGAFSIGSAPETPFSLAGAQSFEVEIVLGGAVTGRQVIGSLGINFNLQGDPQGAPATRLEQNLSATVYTTGDSFALNENPTLDLNLAGWTASAGGTHVSPGFGESAAKVRLKGRNDDGEPDSFGQTEIPSGASDFAVEFLLAIPDFQTAVGVNPDASFQDRSFQFVIHSDTNIPTASNGVWDDGHAESAMINLAYLPAGDGSTGEGFYLFDGTSWQWLSELGTLQKSIDANESGALDAGEGDTVNAYQITVEGSDFGTATASYTISVSAVNSTEVAAETSPLTAYHATSITDHTPSAYTFTTGDYSNSSGSGPHDPSWSSSFWIDEVIFTHPTGLPFPALTISEHAGVVRAWPGAETPLFNMRNAGLGAELNVNTIDVGNLPFSLVSPSLPVGIEPTRSSSVNARIDSSLNEEERVLGEIAIGSNNALTDTNLIDFEALVFAPGNYVFGSFEFPIEPGMNGFHGWTRIGSDNVTAVSGLVPESSTAAYIGEGAGLETDLLEPLANFEMRMYFAVQGSPGDRTFALRVLGEIGTTPRISLKYEDGIWSAFDGGWHDLLTTDLTPSVDASGDGGLDDPNDTKAVYLLEITGHNFDDPDQNSYDMAVYDSNGTLLDSITDASHFHGTSGLSLNRFVATAQIGGNPGFWLDDLTITSTETVSEEFRVTYVAFDPAAMPNTILRWTDIGGEYEIVATNELPFEESGSVSIDVTSDNGMIDTDTYTGEIQFSFDDPGATNNKRFWKIRQVTPAE